MWKQACFFIAAVLFSLSAGAHDGNDGWVTAQGYALWSGTYNDPQIRITVKDGYYNPAGCSNVDSYLIDSGLSAEAKSRAFSLLTAAHFASKPVRLYVKLNGCELGRPSVQVVVVE